MDSITLTENLLSPIVLESAVVLLLVYLLRTYLTRSEKPSFPVAKFIPGKPTQSLIEAVAQYPDTPFILPLKENWVILPNSVMDEVKSFPEDQINSQKLTSKTLQGRYMKIFSRTSTVVVDSVRNQLTRNIARVINDLQDEVTFTMNKTLGSMPDWTSVCVFQAILNIVAGLSARTFVGLPLCRDEEWIASTINLPMDAMSSVMAIKNYHPWIRPFVVPFLSQLKRWHEVEKHIARKINPQLKAILNAYRHSGSVNTKLSATDIKHDEVTDENNSLVHWMIQNSHSPSQIQVDQIAAGEIGAAFAAIHTTSMALSHILFDLAANPQYVSELREEFEGVIEAENYPDKLLRKTSMPKLKKLDSFIKESQRLSPPGLITLGRLVTAKNGVVLSTGDRLPYGTVIGFCSPLFPGSPKEPTTFPADIKNSMPPLTEFYPWRFSEIRRNPGQENRHQFVSLDNDNLSFGTGPHACPGRFFASNEIKLVVTGLLKHYDIGLGPQGQGEGGDYLRPKMIEEDFFYRPDPTARVYLRNRKM